jgi:hypothetical protein
MWWVLPSNVCQERTIQNIEVQCFKVIYSTSTSNSSSSSSSDINSIIQIFYVNTGPEWFVVTVMIHCGSGLILSAAM